MIVASEASDKHPVPEFKFRPTKKELINHLLKPKIEGLDSRVDRLVATVDVYKLEPEDLPGKSKIPDEKKWYFLCLRERMGGKENRFKRGTRSGYWKSTCKVKPIVDKQSGECISERRSLVYYTKSTTTRGGRTNWIIYEYSLPHQSEGSYVICCLKENRKKMKNKAGISESTESESNADTPSSGDVIPPENDLEETRNYISPSQSPDIALLDGSESRGNVTSDSGIQQVNSHVVIDDTFSPEHYPCLYEDSDVSVFASLDELFSGTSQQFHSLSSQLISPEIGMANLPEYPVENLDDVFHFPDHQLFGGFPSSS